MACSASAAGVTSTVQENCYVNVLEDTRSENTNSCKDRTHSLNKIRPTNTLSSLRRKKSDCRVVLPEEQEFDKVTIILADPGVKTYWDWKLKDSCISACKRVFTFLTMDVTNHLSSFLKAVMVLLSVAFLQVSVN